MAQRFNSTQFVRSTLWPQAEVERAETMLKRALAEYLWRFTREPTSAVRTLVAFLEKVVRPGDVIITFNWDLTVERASTLCGAATSYDLEYSYSGAATLERAKRQRQIFLLKPHGSIDWFTEGQARSVPSAAPNDFVRVGPGLMAYNSFRLRPHHHMSGHVPVIIPPTPFKEFRFKALREIWRGAFRALRKAETVYVLGYSLPREDQFARFVLRRVFRLVAKRNRDPEVIVVNPEESVRETFTRVLGPELKVVFKKMRFERWLELA